MIGSVLDKYEVLQKVGEGGMATVYRGRHTTLDRDVAIKVLHPHLSSSTRNRKRFAREARAIEHLRHDNILEIYDYSGIESSDCYIITEFVQGQTLTQLTDEHGPLPSEVVALIGIRLARALAYAHAANILHRDLKPENVMVRVDGRVKLMDFGIARFLDESQVTLTGALIGSPAFMSPEQAREGELDQRSDLFSMGTVLYYMVTGCLPFTGSNPSLILKKVIEGDRPAVNDLEPQMSPTLADVIECLLSTDPDGRYNTAAEVEQALLGTLDEVGIDADDQRWCITAFLRDPEGYQRDLDRHVRRELLARGRQQLEDGEALVALRLLNRLLSIDEGNAEVLALVQSLHTEPEDTTPVSGALRPILLAPVAGGLLIIAAIALLWFAMQPTARPQEEAAQPEPTMVAEPVPEPPPVSIVQPEPTTEPGPDVPEPATAPTPNPRPAPAPLPPKNRRELLTPPPDPEANNDAVAMTPAQGPGTVRLRTNLAADVYVDGVRVGNTRTPIRLDPGAYELEIRGDVVVTRRIRVEVAPGDKVTKVVQLQARPATVRLAPTFDEACAVIVDGSAVGSVGTLSHRVAIQNPDRAGHRLEVRCADGDPFVHVWSSVVLPDQVIGPD